MTEPARPRRKRRPLVLGILLALGILLYLYLRVSLTVAPDEALRRGDALLKHQRVLALVGHPDDLEWYIGGTLRRLADQGAQVHVIVSSSGEKGPNRTGVSDLPATREAEQRAAGEINGYTEIHFLRLPDRGTASAPGFLEAVLQVVKQVGPDAVLMFDPHLPSLPYLHADHQGTARVFLGHWQQLNPQQRPMLYLFQTRRPDTAVDITGAMDTKVRALAAHLSQGQDPAGARMKSIYRAEGKRVGVEYAENFRTLQ